MTLAQTVLPGSVRYSILLLLSVWQKASSLTPLSSSSSTDHERRAWAATTTATITAAVEQQLGLSREDATVKNNTAAVELCIYLQYIVGGALLMLVVFTVSIVSPLL